MAGGGVAYMRRRGSEVIRAPPKPQLEAVPIICHCIQMWNPRPSKPDNTGSTCAVRCIDLAMGIPYPLDQFEKWTYTYCCCRCTTTYEASAVRDIMVCQLLDEDGEKAMKARETEIKELAEITGRGFEEVGWAEFSLAAWVMKDNGIIMSSLSFEDGMYDCAASNLVRNFHPNSNHAAYLQTVRQKGHAGTVVVNPVDGADIDTRVFTCGRAKHRECNNQLIVVDEG